MNSADWSVLFLALVIASLALTGCSSPEDDPAPSEDPQTVLADSTTITSVLRTDARFSTLATSLDSTGLDSLLAAEGPYTLFAPTNDAFNKLPDGTVSDLLDQENRERLRTILRHHVLARELKSEDAAGLSMLPTLEGTQIPVSADDETLRAGGATVLDADIVTGNGIIHVVDAVLRPPAVEGEE